MLTYWACNIIILPVNDVELTVPQWWYRTKFKGQRSLCICIGFHGKVLVKGCLQDCLLWEVAGSFPSAQEPIPAVYRTDSCWPRTSSSQVMVAPLRKICLRRGKSFFTMCTQNAGVRIQPPRSGVKKGQLLQVCSKDLPAACGIEHGEAPVTL